MKKKDYNREDLKKNMMKNIIFRIDYHGVFDHEYILKSFQKVFDSKFKSLESTFQDRVDYELNNIEDISETLSIPIKEIQKQEIFRFTKNTFGSDDLILDISKYFSTLQVNCTNYKNIDKYLNFFSEYIDFLYDHHHFLNIKKIGIRKIGGKIYFNIPDIYKDFNQKYFNFDFKGTEYDSIRNRYVDVLNFDDKSPIINYVRSFESGLYHKKNVNGETKKVKAYQVLLDIDAYFSESILKKIKFEKGKAKSILENTNNKHLFSIFKMSVTKNYLKINSNE